ncbi:iron-containing alcohol dehydrogenase [Desulfovibrio sulfodismutans]|uniref:Iron-containing alcohol dehydrogenase n=1 Tax=Desulfolutivibrio sulfodismutans TaxID=63561 RepID=A0A7K3NGJ3_9BACT|nr:iron-containing alcohol dehydrogenase [Desulfolutivibrio sulfodismutans]QLA11013.1 iron-containing alcohol dehydrogenase [Desulfolutivibrio sulfodismutans DSM 3696]
MKEYDVTHEATTELRKFVAPEFVFGPGSARLAGRYARNLRVKKALVVTGPNLIRLGWAGQVIDSLREAGVSTTIFADVTPNPRDYEVMAGAEVYRREDCDAIVAVGGGSPMDCAKAIGIVCTNDRHVLEFEGVDNVRKPGPPLVCVPTTSGTGADVSQFAIINDTKRKVKIAIVSKTVIPDAALIDPLPTGTMDPELTAHTGLDALTHAIEAYVSNAHSPITDLFAVKAVELVRDHLVSAIRHPDDQAARSGMMFASLYAGLAFSNAILGAVHAMAHSLGGFLDLPHGQCNAILLDHVTAYNYSSAPGRYTDIAKILGAHIEPDMAEDEKKQAVVAALRALKTAAGVDQTLSDLGVRPSELAELSAKAINDPCMITNPRQPTVEDIRSLYEAACRFRA